MIDGIFIWQFSRWVSDLVHQGGTTHFGSHYKIYGEKKCSQPTVIQRPYAHMGKNVSRKTAFPANLEYWFRALGTEPFVTLGVHASPPGIFTIHGN
jgi:hypothetical protein